MKYLVPEMMFVVSTDWERDVSTEGVLDAGFGTKGEDAITHEASLPVIMGPLRLLRFLGGVRNVDTGTPGT